MPLLSMPLNQYMCAISLTLVMHMYNVCCRSTEPTSVNLFYVLTVYSHYVCTLCCSESKGDVVLYQWIEEIREFLNRKAVELNPDGIGLGLLHITYTVHYGCVCWSR